LSTATAAKAIPALPERTILPPRRSAPLNVRELWQYRHLFVALAWRDLAVRYKQTVLGVLWAVIRPVLSVIVFTGVFNRLASIPSGDGTPYPLFVVVGLLFWQCYSDTVLNASLSMVQNAPIIQKVYFPRLIIPLTAATTAMVDMAVGSVVMAGMMAYYGYWPHLAGLLWLPLILAALLLSSTGVGLVAAAMNIKYRDVRHAMPFVLETLKYATPVAYPLLMLDRHPVAKTVMEWGNPVAAVITSARAVLIGSGVPDLRTLGISFAVGTALFAFGLWYFKRSERYFADIV
jgi:lipopolysaccharide transport system permease protein